MVDDGNVYIVSETLTDGSKVFNVKFDGCTFKCITQRDATAFAHKLSMALIDHTNSFEGTIDQS